MPEERGMVISLFFEGKSVKDPLAVAQSIVKNDELLHKFIRDNDWKVYVENWPPRPQEAPKPPAFQPDTKPPKPHDPNAKNPWAVDADHGS